MARIPPLTPKSSRPLLLAAKERFSRKLEQAPDSFCVFSRIQDNLGLKFLGPMILKSKSLAFQLSGFRMYCLRVYWVAVEELKIKLLQ